MTETTRILTRSKTNRMLAGVCGGLGHYFGVDPVLFRILFVILTIIEGSGLLIYFVLWLLIPEESTVENNTAQVVTSAKVEEKRVDPLANRQTRAVIGAIVVLIGIIMLSRSLFAFTWLQWKTIWPLTFIFLGIFIITKRR